MSYTPQVPLVEHRHAGGFIVSLANGHQSIDGVQLSGGHGLLQAGTVLGYSSLAYTAVGAAVAGNTGNGTLGGLAAKVPALPGIYTVTLISATEFIVKTPNGQPVPALGGTVDPGDDQDVVTGPGTVGEVFNAQGIGFKLSAGTTPFVEDDSFTITVSETGEGWRPVTSASADVTRYGLLYRLADTEHGDVRAAAVVRSAEVNAEELVWDDSLSAAQQNAATAALEQQGVVQR